MKREWMIGDTAQVAWTNTGGRSGGNAVCVRVEEGGYFCWRDSRTGWLVFDQQVTDAVPLVVISPEDREQVERLIRAMDVKWGEVDDRTDWCEAIPRMQDVLRELAYPTPPRPDEPMGLGAVVEDAEGTRWVSWRSGLNYHHSRPWQRLEMDTDEWRDYEEIPVASVLFEGVS